MKSSNNNESEFLLLPFKILDLILASLEKGYHLSENIYIRKEIWTQFNAKIEGLNQKYEAFKTISEKIDDLLILAKHNVIKMENIEKFCDLLIDIQNNFSKEFSFIKPSIYSTVYSYNIDNKTVNNNNIYKKFSEISTKLKNKVLDTKLGSKPDYLDIKIKLIKKAKNICKSFLNNFLVSIFDCTYSKNQNVDIIREKKLQISLFFYSTIVKLLLYDLKDLTSRFLKKKILSFENK